MPTALATAALVEWGYAAFKLLDLHLRWAAAGCSVYSLSASVCSIAHHLHMYVFGIMSIPVLVYFSALFLYCLQAHCFDMYLLI